MDDDDKPLVAPAATRSAGSKKTTKKKAGSKKTGTRKNKKKTPKGRNDADDDDNSGNERASKHGGSDGDNDNDGAARRSGGDGDESASGHRQAQRASWLTEDEWEQLHKQNRPARHSLAEFRQLTESGQLTCYTKPALEKIARALKAILTARGRFAAQYGFNTSSVTKKTLADQIAELVTNPANGAVGSPGLGMPTAAAAAAASGLSSGKVAAAAAAAAASASTPARRRREGDEEEAGDGAPAALDAANNNNSNSSSSNGPRSGAVVSLVTPVRKDGRSAGANDAAVAPLPPPRKPTEEEIAQAAAREALVREHQQCGTRLLGRNCLNLMLNGASAPQGAAGAGAVPNTPLSMSFDAHRSPLMEFGDLLARVPLRFGDSTHQFELPASLRSRAGAAAAASGGSGMVGGQERVVLIPVQPGSFQPARWPVPPKEVLHIRVNGQRVAPDYKKNWPESRVGDGSTIQRSYLPVDITPFLVTAPTIAAGANPVSMIHNTHGCGDLGAYGFGPKRVPQQTFRLENKAEAYQAELICCVVRMLDLRRVVARFLHALLHSRASQERMLAQLRAQYQHALAPDDDEDEDIQIGLAAAATASVSDAAAAAGSSGGDGSGSGIILNNGNAPAAAAVAAQQVAGIQISTRCPVSRMCINVPVRSVHCRHLQCVDLVPFVLSCHVACFWNCPQCDRPMRMADLVVDPLVEALVAPPSSAPAAAAPSSSIVTYTLLPVPDLDAAVVAAAIAASSSAANVSPSATRSTNNLALSQACGVPATWIVAHKRAGKSKAAAASSGFFDRSDDSDREDGADDGDAADSSKTTTGATLPAAVFNLSSAASMSSTQQQRVNTVDVDDDFSVAASSRPQKQQQRVAMGAGQGSASLRAAKAPPTPVQTPTGGAPSFRKQSAFQVNGAGSGAGAGALLRTGNTNTSSSSGSSQRLGHGSMQQQPLTTRRSGTALSRGQLAAVGNSKDDAICLD